MFGKGIFSVNLLSLKGSLLAHGFLFAAASAALVEPPLFSVDAGASSVATVEWVELEAASDTDPIVDMEPDADLKKKLENRKPAEESTVNNSGAMTEAAPALLSNPAPKYPESSRRSGEEGLVLLKVQVSADGLPVQVWVEKSSGFSRLDRSALETIKRWNFSPARIGSLAVESSVRVPVRFALTEKGF